VTALCFALPYLDLEVAGEKERGLTSCCESPGTSLIGRTSPPGYWYAPALQELLGEVHFDD
jgi:hypothetical protein